VAFEAKNTLQEIFQCYRICTSYLAQERVDHKAPIKAKKGYANARDPDLIRVFPVHHSGPKGFSGTGMLTREDLRRQDFVDYIDRKVRRLPEIQRGIVRIRYLSCDPLPIDEDVKTALGISWRTFCRQKALALSRLAKDLNAVQIWTN